MRRIEAAVLLAFLASCAVKTTSDALCRTDKNCPKDERCQLTGADSGRCVACVSDPTCTGQDTFSCAADGKKLVCRQNEGSCWYRVEQDCASGLVCGTPGGVSQCVCPARSDAVSYYADAVHGQDGSSPIHPTGASSPPQCRFRTLTEALAQARAVCGPLVAQPNLPLCYVIATGSGGPTAPVVFPASAETFPLDIPMEISLKTDEFPPGVAANGASAAASGAYVVEFDSAAHAALSLHDGASVFGLVLRNTSTQDGARAAISIGDCDGYAKVWIGGLSIEGLSPGNFGAASGVEISGPCDVKLTNLVINQTSGDGLMASGGAKVDATDLAVAGSTGGNGVTITGPITAVALHGARLTGNAKNGIEVAEGGSLQIDTQGGHAVAISDNGLDGLRIQTSSATLAGTSDFPIAIADNVGAGILYCNGETADCGKDQTAAFQASFLKVERNRDGVQIDDEAGAAVGLTSSSFSDNLGAGLRIDRSGVPLQGKSSTVVDQCRFTGGLNGISLTGNGVTWVTVKGSQLSGASDTAFVAELLGAGYSGVELVDNTIAGNGGQTPRGTTKRPVGGLFFTSGVPSLTFQGNKVMKNTGDQLFVSSSDTSTPWRFDGPSDCSKPNVFACYASGQGVNVDGKANVYLGYATWPGEPPSKGTDYMNFGGGVMSLSVPSTPSATSLCGVVPDGFCN